jgi:hypothetical protein
MHTIHNHKSENFLCPACGIESDTIGMMAAIVPRYEAAPGYVYLACPGCTERHKTMSGEQRKYYVQKIESKIAKHPARYKALRTVNGEAARRIAEGYVASGSAAKAPMEALVEGVLGAAKEADAIKDAKKVAEADDKVWFDQNLHRYYRLRPAMAHEFAGITVGYEPKHVLVIQMEPGKRSKAMIPEGVEGWPNEDDFLEGALLAATEQGVPVGCDRKMDGWNAWRALMPK